MQSFTPSSSSVLPGNAAVTQLMEPIDAILSQFPGATEFIMNRPGEAFIEQQGRWHRIDVPQLTLRRCLELANSVAIYARQDISERAPLLSATLPAGQRIQLVVPPAVEMDKIVICIRIPGSSVRPLESYVSEGAFSKFIWTPSSELSALLPAESVALPLNTRHDITHKLTTLDKQLLAHLHARDLSAFLISAIRGKKNIAVIGDTGSGKTTLMKALCQFIPVHERIVTIEDVRELFLPLHANICHLLYSKGSQGVAQVSPADLIGASMRLKPDRVLLAELRGSEAFDYLKLMTAGHSGSITSFHAESCSLAAQRYVFMAKEHADAAIFTDEALKRLVGMTVDITLHVTAEPIEDGTSGDITGVERYVTEVSFDPTAKRALSAA